MKKTLIGIAAAAFSVGCAAEFLDGNKLHERLTSTSFFEQGMALGYIMGAADTGLNVLHCTPPNATAGQLQDMVLQHLRLFPERRTKTADTIVADTLRAAWPCPKKDSNGRTL